MSPTQKTLFLRVTLMFSEVLSYDSFLCERIWAARITFLISFSAKWSNVHTLSGVKCSPKRPEQLYWGGSNVIRARDIGLYSGGKHHVPHEWKNPTLTVHSGRYRKASRSSACDGTEQQVHHSYSKPWKLYPILTTENADYREEWSVACLPAEVFCTVSHVTDSQLLGAELRMVCSLVTNEDDKGKWRKRCKRDVAIQNFLMSIGRGSHNAFTFKHA